MRSWIFRHLQHLEAIYGAPGRPRPLTEPNRGGKRALGAPERLRVHALVPRPRGALPSAGRS